MLQKERQGTYSCVVCSPYTCKSAFFWLHEIRSVVTTGVLQFDYKALTCLKNGSCKQFAK